jgi:cell division protein FtsB
MSEPRRGVSTVGLILLALVAALILGDLNRRMGNARQLERDAATLGTEVASLQAENGQLQTAIAGATGEAQVAEWARSQGRMVRPGEHLVVPLSPGDATPQATPTPAMTYEQPSNWQIWWTLLFGS